MMSSPYIFKLNIESTYLCLSNLTQIVRNSREDYLGRARAARAISAIVSFYLYRSLHVKQE